MIQPAPKCYECRKKIIHEWKCSEFEKIPFFIITGGKCDFYVKA